MDAPFQDMPFGAKEILQGDQRYDATTDPSAGIDGMPPNLGEHMLPHVFTFQGIASSQAKVYRPSDEAIKDSFENARFMRNDITVMECVEMRQRAVCLLDWGLEPEDERNEEHKQLCEELTKIVKKIPRFMQYRENLLHATFFGKYGIEQRWGYRQVGGQSRSLPVMWLPIHGDKIVFRYDDGLREHRPDQIGVRIGAGYTTGPNIAANWMSANMHKVQATDWGLAYFMDSWERTLLALHKYQIEDGEYEEPTNSGRIHGKGLRSVMYWAWFQKQETLAFLMEYLERSAAGIEIWYYPMGNPQAETAMRTAAEERIGLGRNIVMVPRPQGEDGMMYDVQRIEPSMAGASELKAIITEYFGHAIKRYILGQTLTSEASSTGLGSNLADIHMDTFMQIVRYDSNLLEETITAELIDPIKRYNFPKYANVDVNFRIHTTEPDAEETMQAMQTAYEMGLRLDAQQLRDLIGSPKPDDNAEVLDRMEQQQQEQQAQQQQQMDPATGGMPVPGGMPGDQPPDGMPPEMDSTTQTAPAEATEPAEYMASDVPSENGDRKRVLRSDDQRPDTYARGGGADPFCYGAGWKESEHPRDDDGKFGSGGGGGVGEFFQGKNLKRAGKALTKMVAEHLGKEPDDKLTGDECRKFAEEAGVEPDMIRLYGMGKGMALSTLVREIQIDIKRNRSQEIFDDTLQEIGDATTALFSDPDHDNVQLMLHRSVRQGGLEDSYGGDEYDWQLTTVSRGRDGHMSPMGHTSFNDREKAIKSAIGALSPMDNRGTSAHQVAWTSKSGRPAPFSRETFMEVLRYKRTPAPNQTSFGWEEDDHPRDADGQFAEKEEAKEPEKVETKPEPEPSKEIKFSVRGKGKWTYRGESKDGRFHTKEMKVYDSDGKEYQMTVYSDGEWIIHDPELMMSRGGQSPWEGRVTSGTKDPIAAAENKAAKVVERASTGGDVKASKDKIDGLMQDAREMLMQFSPEDKILPVKARQYRHVFRNVTDRLGPKAIQSLADGTKKVQFHKSHDSMGSSFGGNVLGVYSYNGRDEREGTLHLNGLGDEAEESSDGGNQQAVYAHEMTHAIDGPNNIYSNTRKWVNAWKAEICHDKGVQPTSVGKDRYIGTAAGELKEGDKVERMVGGKRKTCTIRSIESAGSKYRKGVLAIYVHDGTSELEPFRVRSTSPVARHPLNEAPPAKLTDYATTEKNEGFAEFGRAIILEPEMAEKKYPKCFELWKEWDLVN